MCFSLLPCLSQSSRHSHRSVRHRNISAQGDNERKNTKVQRRGSNLTRCTKIFNRISLPHVYCEINAPSRPLARYDDLHTREYTGVLTYISLHWLEIPPRYLWLNFHNEILLEIANFLLFYSSRVKLLAVIDSLPGGNFIFPLRTFIQLVWLVRC